FQVGFVDAREASGNHRGAAKKPRRERSMFPAAAFAVVEIPNDHPARTARPVVAGDFGKGLIELTGQYVSAAARLAREGVGRDYEHVIAEFGEVARVAKPWPGRRDVIGRRLTLAL